MPQASAANNEALSAVMDTIGNLALLEKKINHGLGSKPFEEKRTAYGQSSFLLTQELADVEGWSVDGIDDRAKELAELASSAWPYK